MALILNIETATTVCSVSLAKDGVLLALKEQNGDYSHSENLTLFIEDVCASSNTKLIDIDAVAVSKGPGSYTGLRIGVSTAKGLCYSLNKPLIAINTLQQIALGVSANFNFDSGNSNKLNTPILFCPMLDARRMEVYCAIYDKFNNEVVPTAAEIIDEHSFTEILTNNTIVFFGDGAAKCKNSLAVNKNALFIDNVFPSAKNMITLSESAFINKQFEDVAYFEPFYLKDFMIGKKKQTE
jgi:tRNA threonylcarbamoyladenosine biosynthesis protein TsaB